MASSVSGQDKPNHALWLATQAAGWSYLARLGLPPCVPPEKFPFKPNNKLIIDQAFSVNMAAYWPHSFFCKFMDLSVSVHKYPAILTLETGYYVITISNCLGQGVFCMTAGGALQAQQDG